jgi:hypothetical protein
LLQIKWHAQAILSDAIKRAGAWFAKIKYWKAWVKKPLIDWIHTMLYTSNEIHLPFYLFPGYPDYNDRELAKVFKAAIPHVVELLAAFTSQFWLILTQALLPSSISQQQTVRQAVLWYASQFTIYIGIDLSIDPRLESMSILRAPQDAVD